MNAKLHVGNPEGKVAGNGAKRGFLSKCDTSAARMKYTKQTLAWAVQDSQDPGVHCPGWQGRYSSLAALQREEENNPEDKLRATIDLMPDGCSLF